MQQTAVVWEWPFAGPFKGATVRFFEPVGPLRMSMWGPEWRVRDIRKANPKGGPEDGRVFGSREEAEAFIAEHA